jgi:hypothetical protein
MIENILNNWNFMRVLRLVLGIFIISQGVELKEWMLVALGGIFSIMPLLNIGCGGAAGCNTRVQKNNRQSSNISYEEVK